ncbi:MAG: LytR C-terminal domain-containing protein [Actinomycetota bacterium]|nr:LytR C-terminal domain-containing protein [Actinomycetota bacterium]
MSERVRRGGRALPSWTLLGSVMVVAVGILGFLITASPDQAEQAAGSPLPTSPTRTQQEPTPVESPPKQRAREKREQPAAKESDKKAEKESDKKAEKSVQKPADREGEKKVEKLAVKPTAYVEVFNNSAIAGLAADAAAELVGSGWDVVGTDDWYGEIPQSTVYYPQRLRAQAELLAEDVGTERVMPAVDPMRFDRLTVILTGDL